MGPGLFSRKDHRQAGELDYEKEMGCTLLHSSQFVTKTQQRKPVGTRDKQCEIGVIKSCFSRRLRREEEL